MERLTTNKAVSEMSMYELAHNSCYVKDGKARYRDFEEDLDARELARVLIKKYLGEDAPQRDDAFDDYICDCLQYDVCSTDGIIAVFYRNLLAMAEMREKLAEYEDLEESGRIIKLPCAVGDTVYVDSRKIPTITMDFETVADVPLYFMARVVSLRQNSKGKFIKLSVRAKWLHEWIDPEIGRDSAYYEMEKYFTYPLSDVGKIIFLTREAAEAKLKEMEGEHGE